MSTIYDPDNPCVHSPICCRGCMRSRSLRYCLIYAKKAEQDLKFSHKVAVEISKNHSDTLDRVIELEAERDAMRAAGDRLSECLDCAVDWLLRLKADSTEAHVSQIESLMAPRATWAEVTAHGLASAAAPEPAVAEHDERRLAAIEARLEQLEEGAPSCSYCGDDGRGCQYCGD